MWPFSLLKKLSQDPEVGQTRGDYIGCYLLGTQTAGRDDDRLALQDLLNHWPARAKAHLAAANGRPLAVQGGSLLFLRTGMRARKKEKGVYLE